MAHDAWCHPRRPMQAREQAASTVVWVNNGANGIWCKWESYRTYRAGRAPSYFSLSRSLLSPLESFTRVACFGYLREEGRSQGVQDFVPILNARENGSQGQVKNKENWFGGQGHHVKGPECCQNIFIIAVFVMEKTRPCVRRLRGESWAWKGVWEQGGDQNPRIHSLWGPESLCLQFASLVWVCGWTMMLFPTERGSFEPSFSLSLSPGAERLETNPPSAVCRRKLFYASPRLYFSPMPTTYLQRRAVYFNKILLLLELWPDFVSIFWRRKDSSGMKLATHSASVLIVWEFLAGENLWAQHGIYFLFKFGSDFTLYLKRGTMAQTTWDLLCIQKKKICLMQ